MAHINWIMNAAIWHNVGETGKKFITRIKEQERSQILTTKLLFENCNDHGYKKRNLVDKYQINICRKQHKETEIKITMTT